MTQSLRGTPRMLLDLVIAVAVGGVVVALVSGLAAYLSRQNALHIRIEHDQKAASIKAAVEKLDPETVARLLRILGSGTEATEMQSHSPQAVPPGTILWNPPDTMKGGRGETIEVRLGDATVAEKALREGLHGRGMPNVDRLEISPLMRVALIGDKDDFLIQGVNSADQLVRPGQVSRWDFHVVPLRSGR